MSRTGITLAGKSADEESRSWMNYLISKEISRVKSVWKKVPVAGVRHICAHLINFTPF